MDVEAVWRGLPRRGRGLRAAAPRLGQPRRRVPGGAGARHRPAAARTRIGAICSVPVVKGALTHVDTWAGRGGLARGSSSSTTSRAVIYGGDYEDVDLTDRKLVDGIFDQTFHKPLKLVDLEKTTKYRYDPKFKTGGTFGSNFHALKDRVLSFNYRSVGWPDERRLGIARPAHRAPLPQAVRRRDRRAQEAASTAASPAARSARRSTAATRRTTSPTSRWARSRRLRPARGGEGSTAAPTPPASTASRSAARSPGSWSAWSRAGWTRSRPASPSGPRWEPERLDAVADSAHNAEIAVKAHRLAARRPAGPGLPPGHPPSPRGSSAGKAQGRRRLQRHRRRPRLHGPQPVLGPGDVRAHADPGPLLPGLRPRVQAALRAGQGLRACAWAAS